MPGFKLCEGVTAKFDYLYTNSPLSLLFSLVTERERERERKLNLCTMNQVVYSLFIAVRHTNERCAFNH